MFFFQIRDIIPTNNPNEQKPKHIYIYKQQFRTIPKLMWGHPKSTSLKQRTSQMFKARLMPFHGTKKRLVDRQGFPKWMMIYAMWGPQDS